MLSWVEQEKSFITSEPGFKSDYPKNESCLNFP